MFKKRPHITMSGKSILAPVQQQYGGFMRVTRDLLLLFFCAATVRRHRLTRQLTLTLTLRGRLAAHSALKISDRQSRRSTAL